jgi:sulfur carrier protein
MWKEGLTIKELIEMNNFVYPRIIVLINDKHISDEEYATTVINDSDDVKVIHLLAGG